jgi:predicted nucleic acid-binding protein
MAMIVAGRGWTETMTHANEATVMPKATPEDSPRAGRANEIVVDTTVIIAVLTNESTKRQILDLTVDAVLVAPSSLDIEIGNAFSRMFKRERIDLETAERALQSYLQIPIDIIDIDLLSAVRLSQELDIFAYDAYVIDCARKLGAPLISLDGGLLEACRRAKVEIIEVNE